MIHPMNPVHYLVLHQGSTCGASGIGNRVGAKAKGKGQKSKVQVKRQKCEKVDGGNGTPGGGRVQARIGSKHRVGTRCFMGLRRARGRYLVVKELGGRIKRPPYFLGWCGFVALF